MSILSCLSGRKIGHKGYEEIGSPKYTPLRFNEAGFFYRLKNHVPYRDGSVILNRFGKFSTIQAKEFTKGFGIIIAYNEEVKIGPNKGKYFYLPVDRDGYTPFIEMKDPDFIYLIKI